MGDWVLEGSRFILSRLMNVTQPAAPSHTLYYIQRRTLSTLDQPGSAIALMDARVA